MLLDPRKSEYQEWWEGENSTPNRAAALQSREHFLWLLDFHGVKLRTARILELGSGEWQLLASIQKLGINITGIDIRPRPFDDTLPIFDADVHELGNIIEKWFYDAVVSRDLLDTKYYKQDITRIGRQISKILGAWGLYIWKEPNTLELELPGTRKSIIKWQFQVFRKWAWFVAENYDFSRKFHI